MNKSVFLKRKLPYIFILILILFIGHVMLELGDHYSSAKLVFSMKLRYLLLNLAIEYALFALFSLITGNLWSSGLFYVIFCGLIAMINYYVIEWHGMPLSLQELSNIKTAVNVLGAYRFSLFGHAYYIIGILAVALFAACFLRRFRADCSIPRKYRIWMFAVSLVALFLLWRIVSPPDPLGWEWRTGYQKEGYAVSTACRILNNGKVIKPDGYDPSQLDQYVISARTEKPAEEGLDNNPDIIMILNEAFFDMSILADFETDVPVLEKIKSLEQVKTGYAVVPVAGGGTNQSEYEFLTGNAERLFPGIAPFNQLNLEKASSVVSNLESLGYHTLAAHPKEPINYNRINGYPALGFDDVLFEEDFTGLERYHEGWFYTDESVYRNLIRWYEASDHEDPQLYYLLTIQNHSDYQQFPKEYNTVHARNNYGEEQLDEYLTYINMSDEAFVELVEYFSQVDRDVVICMVGDHCPNIAVSLANDNLPEKDYRILLRSTPFVIWSNVFEGREDLGTMSLNYLLPTLLKSADMPLSPYFRFMLDLKEKVPILTEIGYYITSDGEEYAYDEESPFQDDVNTYFYMVYNNVKDDDKKLELFELSEQQ